VVRGWGVRCGDWRCGGVLWGEVRWGIETGGVREEEDGWGDGGGGD